MFPFIKTISSFPKAKLLPIVIKTIVITFITIILLSFGVSYCIGLLLNFETQWLTESIKGLSWVATLVISWFILPVFTVLISGFFSEEVIQKVEAVYYPNSKRNGSGKFVADLMHDIKFTLLSLGLNILILPLYFLGGIGFFVSIILNSYLLGREFFEGAAGYHHGKPKAKLIGKEVPVPMYGGGFVITLINLVPIVNLFTPIVAIVWMIHVYHKTKSHNKVVGLVGT